MCCRATVINQLAWLYQMRCIPAATGPLWQDLASKKKKILLMVMECLCLRCYVCVSRWQQGGFPCNLVGWPLFLFFFSTSQIECVLKMAVENALLSDNGQLKHLPRSSHAPLCFPVENNNFLFSAPCLKSVTCSYL